MLIMLSFLSFSFTVLYQPDAMHYYVYAVAGTVTNYSEAKNGNIGLLAHEELAGKTFTQLKQSDIITLRFSDERIEKYQVSHVLRYVALEPYNISSPFINMETKEISAAIDLGNSLYVFAKDQLVLQTCYDNAHGRLFVVATLIKSVPMRSNQAIRMV
jgi:sortase (surface protein transpeptidase)